MARIVIRDARPEDHSALQRIYEQASLSNAGDRAGLLAHPEFLVLDTDLIGRGRTRIATLVDDTIVGFASTSRLRDRVLELDDLFVDPDWQRHGAARELIVQICKESTREDVSRIEVTANTHAIQFYLALGFEGDEPVATTLGGGLRMHLTIE
jgi:N-acetylglutamate synthase-like GNAT family acetyltransferase